MARVIWRGRRLDLADGDYVALGLVGRRCPVGRVTATTWDSITIDLKSFVTGYPTGELVTVRTEELLDYDVAHHRDGRREGGVWTIDDRHLADLQSTWHRGGHESQAE